MYLKKRSAEWRPFCSGGDELSVNAVIDTFLSHEIVIKQISKRSTGEESQWTGASPNGDFITKGFIQYMDRLLSHSI